MIRLFYKRMIQSNKLRACFDQSFLKAVFSRIVAIKAKRDRSNLQNV